MIDRSYNSLVILSFLVKRNTDHPPTKSNFEIIIIVMFD